MKRTGMMLVACLLAALLCLGCGTKPAAEPLAEVTPTPMAEETAGAEQMVGMPSPIHEVSDYAALLAAQPKNMLSDAPDGSTDVRYSYIDGEPVISQIQFTYEGNDYTYRSAVANEATQIDISGVYDELNKTRELTVEDNVTLGGKYALRCSDTTTSGLATWYYTPTGCQYSLWTLTGCNNEQAIEEVVDALLPIGTDAEGNPLAIATTTPLPAATTGKVQGTVADVQSNVLTLQLTSGSTLQFMLSGIRTPDAKKGDVVEIVYSGNPLDAPEAVTITVLSSAPAATSVSGTVFRFTKQSVFVQTANTNTFGFIINNSTAFKGLSTTLKSGNQVTITYTGELSNSPVATVIETTAVSTDPEPTAEPSEPTDKTLSGLVTALKTKSVTVYTDTGHTYTFKRDGSTYVTGDYMLEYGCRIRVLYDGYASNSPLARRIDVLTPPDPTPPDPTPYVPTKHTISGTISMTAGNALVVEADNGAEYSFLLRAPSIDGDIVVGFRITVTYQVEADGTMNATKIVTTPPVVYGPGPVLMDEPLSGMVSFDEPDPELADMPNGGMIAFD